MVQDIHVSGHKYWATRSSVRSFARIAHSLTHSRTLKKVNDKILEHQAVLSLYFHGRSDDDVEIPVSLFAYQEGLGVEGPSMKVK